MTVPFRYGRSEFFTDRLGPQFGCGYFNVKFNTSFVQRFQKTYEALEVEGTMEKKQLAVLHQQRVQSELNDKKRRALDNYMTAVEEEESDVCILMSHVCVSCHYTGMFVQFKYRLCMSQYG